MVTTAGYDGKWTGKNIVTYDIKGTKMRVLLVKVSNSKIPQETAETGDRNIEWVAIERLPELIKRPDMVLIMKKAMTHWTQLLVSTFQL